MSWQGSYLPNVLITLIKASSQKALTSIAEPPWKHTPFLPRINFKRDLLPLLMEGHKTGERKFFNLKFFYK
jgi:hypothetical protein